MKILVINCGSSSLKFQLLNMNDQSEIAKGLVERIGINGSQMVLKYDDKKHTVTEPMKDHNEALKIVLNEIASKEHGLISSLDEIDAVGHRVVHGGEYYSESVLIDEDVLDKIELCNELAPLHNPANLMGIRAIETLMPNVKNVAVFDTAFHQTMEKPAYIYPIPYEYYEKHSVRRYGFHGTSHKYVSQKTAEFLGKDIKDLNIITCHLGNGSSITAVEKGRSIDTSMGFTPLEGLEMGTRSGLIDPAIVAFMMKKENLTVEEATDILNKKSGVLGVSGLSSDFRDLEEAQATNERADLALKIFRRGAAKFISSYMTMMHGADVVVFTGGIGENSSSDRKAIMEYFEYMGVKIDDEVNNKTRGKAQIISTQDSTIKVLVMPTNEELAIALDTQRLVK